MRDVRRHPNYRRFYFAQAGYQRLFAGAVCHIFWSMSDWNMKGLTKSSTDKWIGGVCGGFGSATPIPSWLWRAGFLFAAIAYGFGLLLYRAVDLYAERRLELRQRWTRRRIARAPKNLSTRPSPIKK